MKTTGRFLVVSPDNDYCSNFFKTLGEAQEHVETEITDGTIYEDDQSSYKIIEIANSYSIKATVSIEKDKIEEEVNKNRTK